jgi:hypothetical protein
MDKGCGAVHSTLHITQYGDIMPCVYIHIGIGNVFTGTLQEAIDLGMSIKWFKEYSRLCLSGEHRHFIEHYMSKAYGRQLPVPWQEVFGAEDFVQQPALS